MDYVNNIKSTILETANQYESDKTVNEALSWEMIKLQTRDTSIKYSKAETKKMKNKETDIEVKFPHSPILNYAFSSWIEQTMTKTIYCHWENRFVLQ